MFTSQKLYIYGAIVAAIIALSTMLVLSKVETGQLEVENQTLSDNIETQQVLIKNYNKQIENFSDTVIDLSKKISDNDITLEKQQKVFNSHNLENLLEKKPTLIIKRANTKTAQLFDDFTLFTQEFEKGIK